MTAIVGHVIIPEMRLGQQEAGAQVLFTIRDCMIGETGQARVQISFGRKVVRINEEGLF